MLVNITNRGDNSWFQGEPFIENKGHCSIYGDINNPQMLISYPLHAHQVQAELENKNDIIYNDVGFIEAVAHYFESLGVDKEISALFDWSEFGLQAIQDGYNYSHFDIKYSLAQALEKAIDGKDIIDVEFDLDEIREEERENGNY